MEWSHDNMFSEKMKRSEDWSHDNMFRSSSPKAKQLLKALLFCFFPLLSQRNSNLPHPSSQRRGTNESCFSQKACNSIKMATYEHVVLCVSNTPFIAEKKQWPQDKSFCAKRRKNWSYSWNIWKKKLLYELVVDTLQNICWTYNKYI